MTLRRRIVGALSLAVLLAAMDVRADTSASSEAEARFKEAAALAKRGKYEEALAKYVQSYALEPRASVLLGMALAEYELKRDLEALRHLREYLRSPRAQNVDELKARFLDPLHERTGHLRVRAAASAQVTVDGAPAIVIDDLVDVAPGPHVVVIGAERREVTLAGGETVTLENAAKSASPAPPAATPPPAIEAPRTDVHWLVAGGFLAGAVAASGVGVGFGLASGASTEDAERLRATSPGVCASATPQCEAYRSRAADADTQATISTVGYIAAGACLVGAATSYLLLRPHSTTRTPAAKIVPTLGPSGPGMLVEARF